VRATRPDDHLTTQLKRRESEPMWNTLTSRSASPLARRPYDLRHACLSTWLNAGVPAAQVAEWAGHSVNVLLRVYAKCLDGQEESAKRRIESALGTGS
jgi:integrase